MSVAAPALLGSCAFTGESEGPELSFEPDTQT